MKKIIRYFNFISFINFFPKFINLIKYFLFRIFRFKKQLFKPITFDIEPTTGCNFRCTMCQVSSPNFKSMNMNMETFKTTLKQNKQLIKIKLQGMGEPTVNVNFLEMIKEANKYGVAVDFTTNGSLLNEKMINEMAKLKMSRIIISLDGATKNTFEKIRVRSNFDTVIQNSKKLVNKYKNKFIRPIISAWCVVQKDNVEEIQQIFDLSKDIGFDDLNFQFYISDWGKKEWSEVNKNKRIDLDFNEDISQLLLKLKKSKEIKVEIFKENLLNFKKKCQWPWKSSYIDNQGNVSPCCIVGDSKVKNFGNINKKDFKDIWNSEEYQIFREQVNSNNLPDFCKNCYQEYR